MTDHVPVLIIGAGPTGLSLAVALRCHGVDCLVVERADRPHRQSRGKGLQPRSLEVFRDLRVIEEILHAGEHRQRVRLFKDRRAVADLAVGLAEPGPDIAFPNIVMLPQWRTCDILERRLTGLGGRVERGLTLTALTQDHDRVTATLTDDQEIRVVTADYLIGCDGGRSTARRLLDVEFTGRSRQRDRYLLGDVIINGLSPQTDDHQLVSYAWLGRDGSFLGLAGLPGSDGFQIGASLEVADPDGPASPAGRDVATLQQLLTERSGRPELVITEATWLSDFQVNVAMAEDYRVGRCFLAGDAAHVHPPTGGQGMNTGIQDAYNLAWKLAYVLAGRAGDALLDSYPAERMPVARALLQRSTDILDTMITDNPVTSFLINRVALPLMSRPAINRAVLSRVSQIDVGYPDSPLLPPDAGSGRRRVRPGQRAPGAFVVDDQGRQSRLHDLLDRTRHTLLHWGPVEIDGHLPGWVVVCRLPDTEREVRRRYGLRRGDAVLIRPDGYVAWRGRPENLRPAALVAGEAPVPTGSGAA
ncbi:FAD-dependent monooxygenase [Microlunatus speluncae]|uniref:FAD-dependent monooxygenase n=1 Tax=Microlunatus speluncae TaxID=2594267 RepID=UPI001375E545|nr:FAD-dependent monooxygenase [Microlunatus speluncae]